MRSKHLIVLLTVAFAFSGLTAFCAGPSAETNQPEAAASSYTLLPNDMIDIRVFQEDDLQTTTRVARDGTLNFPLIGVVRVGGKTTQEAAKLLRDLLEKDYLVNPQVTVSVREYSKRTFTILGQVQRPGVYDFAENQTLTLLQAVGMAQGYTRLAEPGRITLKREVNGREAVFKLNAKTMARDGENKAFDILPGDTITVGETIF